MKHYASVIGFWGAVSSLLLLFAASAAAIPLYGEYARQFSLTTSDLALTSVYYFAGTVMALIVLARLSNHIGRKPAMYIVLLLGIAGCLLFMYISNKHMLFIARFIQGLSCGLASNTITAYCIDTEPASLPNLGTSISTGGPNIGLALGALGSGAAAAYLRLPLFAVFAGIAVLLLLSAFFISQGPETMRRQPGVWASLIPQCKAPRIIRPWLLPMACVAAAGWSVGGFYQSYSALITASIFHITDSCITALCCISFIGPIMLGAALARKRNPYRTQRYSFFMYAVLLLLLYVSLQLHHIGLHLLLNLCAGIAEGMMFASSMTILLSQTSKEDRAGVLSVIYILSYAGAAIPNELFGLLSCYLSLSELWLCYAGLGVAAYSIFTLYRHMYLRRPA